MTSAAVPTFEELVARHQCEVLRVCRSIVRDEHLGADAAQETFVRLWRRIAEGRGPEHGPAWLRSVAVSTSLDLVRRRAARPAEEPVDENLPDRRESPVGDTGELRRLLEAAVAVLPEGQRTVFLLRHEGGLALAEVAETLGVSLPTAKTQFARACLKLQEKLARACPRPERDDTP